MRLPRSHNGRISIDAPSPTRDREALCEDPRMRLEPIVRVDKLSPGVFRAEYARLGLPVLITNALDWIALKRWTHEWFRDTYGHTLIELTVNPTHTRRIVKMRSDAHLHRILAHSTTTRPL